jgi:hypothetical protein
VECLEERLFSRKKNPWEVFGMEEDRSLKSSKAKRFCRKRLHCKTIEHRKSWPKLHLSLFGRFCLAALLPDIFNSLRGNIVDDQSHIGISLSLFVVPISVLDL